MTFHSGQTFVFGETPSATKWQYLWDNDYALADGTGIDNNAIAARSLATNAIELGYASVTSDQTGITSITDLTSLSNAVTVPAGSRSILIHGHVHLNGSAANLAELSIRESSTVLRKVRRPMNGSGGWTQAVDIFARLTGVSTGAHTYKLSLALATGSGTVGTSHVTTDFASFIRTTVE